MEQLSHPPVYAHARRDELWCQGSRVQSTPSHACFEEWFYSDSASGNDGHQWNSHGSDVPPPYPVCGHDQWNTWCHGMSRNLHQGWACTTLAVAARSVVRAAAYQRGASILRMLWRCLYSNPHIICCRPSSFLIPVFVAILRQDKSRNPLKT